MAKFPKSYDQLAREVEQLQEELIRARIVQSVLSGKLLMDKEELQILTSAARQAALMRKSEDATVKGLGAVIWVLVEMVNRAYTFKE